jgi:hypothetical protein
MVGPAGARDLSAVERRLVERVREGRELDLAGGVGASPVGRAEHRTIRAQVVRDILLRRLATDPDCHGVAVRGARILGRLNLNHLASPLPLALRDCQIDEGISARDARLETVDLTGSRLTHPSEPALDAAGLVVRASLRLDRIAARAWCGDGAVVLWDAEIDGVLSCAGAVLDNDAGPALSAAGLHLRRSADLGPGVVAMGAGPHGTVRLSGARVGGDLNLAGAQLRNASGPALVADGVRVESSILLTDGFKAAGAHTSPAVALRGARVAGALDVRGAELGNSEGCALDVSDAEVGGDVMLRRVRADGVGGGGAVQLFSTRVGGLVDARGACLRNPAASALDAENVQTGRDLFLDGGFEATGAGADAAALDLASATVGGVFALDPARVHHLDDPSRRLGADGLTYRGLPHVGETLSAWLDLLRSGTPTYAAQPYQQLAAACRAAGHDRDARRVLMQQRRDQLQRSTNTVSERVWTRTTGLTLGYGYQPWRALVLLMLVAATSVALAVGVGGSGGLETAGSATPAPCPLVQRISVGLTTGLPLVSTARDFCQPTDTRPGEILTVTGWVLRVLAWASATLFIAGFTSAVRRP